MYFFFTSPTRSYSYDFDGNLTGITENGSSVFSVSYDAENRVTSITSVDGQSVTHGYSFTYNPDGFMYSQVVDGGSPTYFVRDGANTLQERDNNNAVTRAYAWDPDAPGGIGGLLELATGGAHYNYLYDGKGNVKALIDSSQNPVVNYTYDSFGKRISTTSADGLADVVKDQPYQFSTKFYYPAFGGNYYGYRFYLSGIGKWITRDPLGESADVNLYRAMRNDSANLIDPKGEVAPLVLGGAIILAGGTAGGLIDAYDALREGKSISDIATAYQRGFYSGAAGTIVGMLTAFGTGNPYLIGASVGLTSSAIDELQNGWNDNSANMVLISTTVAAWMGPIAKKMPGLKTRGRLPKLWNFKSCGWGPNSKKLIGQEISAGIVSGQLTSGVTDILKQKRSDNDFGGLELPGVE